VIRGVVLDDGSALLKGSGEVLMSDILDAGNFLEADKKSTLNATALKDDGAEDIQADT
jgi:hypothetical protein